MKLQTLNLQNFRNHLSLTLDFKNSPVTVFSGANGIGKTNILDAIYTLALSKSFRSNHLKDLISWDENYFRIEGKIFSENRKYELEFFYQNEPIKKRVFKKLGLKIPLKKYLGSLLISFFCPEQLNLIYLEPSRRRKYLNLVLSQIFPEYLEAMMKYEQLLIQRNKLLGLILENKASKFDLQSWDKQIIPFAKKITDLRKDFFEEILDDFNEFYDKIAGQSDKLKVDFKYSKDFELDLKNSFAEDLVRKATTVGPHREDFEIYLNNHLASDFASRGECRSIILALKLAERNFFQKKLAKNPIILFDDVFSELDLNRQNHLLKLFSDSQVFITTSMEKHEFKKADDNICFLEF